MRGIVLLVIALLVATGTAYAIRERISQSPSSEESSLPMGTRQVLVAQGDIPAGTFILADKHFTWASWPEDSLHEAYIMKSANHDVTSFNGAVARSSILAGEPIVSSKVVKPDEGGFMSAVLTPGLRAVSIAVNATSGNAGFILPGDRVDLILTHTLPVGESGTTPGIASETFVRNVRVLAVDQRYNNPDNKILLARTVTLEVSPKQAEMINVAVELGKISLSLRSLAKDHQAGAEEAGYTKSSDVSPLIYSRDAKTYNPEKVSVSRGSESKNIEFDRRGQ